MKKMLKEPLVHFLGLALVLFVLFEAVAPTTNRESDPKTIVVTRNALLTFMQYRAKAFEPDFFEGALNDMPEEERTRLIDDYVREEALHREALALGLDRDDYVIRRRLVQKVEFIAQGFAEAAAEMDGDELRDYFETNRQNYYISPSITFTHVFFNNDRHGPEDAQRLATQKLRELEDAAAVFSDATKHGDRFPYLVNYVERAPDYVASHFGDAMMRSLFSLQATDKEWHGPFQSSYGSHIVMVTKNVAGRDPDLEEVRARVMSDAEYEAVRERTEAALTEIVADYDVELDFALATQEAE
jgi:hypothetical protein